MTFSSPELVVVDIHGKAFLNLLLDIVVHNSVRLTRPRCTEAPSRHGKD